MSSSSSVFKSQVRQVASCQLDVLSPYKRKERVQIVTQAIQQDDTCRKTLAEWKDLQGSTLHAQERVVDLYVRAILSETSPDGDSSELLRLLCERLCQLLTRAHNVPLLKQVQRQLKDSAVCKQHFADIARSSAEDFAPALTLSTDCLAKEEWMQVMLQQAFGSQTIATRAQMELMLNVPWTKEDFQTHTLPLWTLKAKANPERTLDAIGGLLKHNNDSSIVVVNEDFASVLFKHYKTKAQAVAQSLLLQLAQTADNWQYLVPPLASMTLSQASQRQNWYATLEQMASTLTPSPDFIETILKALTTALTKEKSGTSTFDTGLQALWKWTVLAKRNTTANQYRTLLQDAAASKDCLSVWGSLVSQVHPDLVESILVEVWNPKFDKALQGMVEAAIKKQESSSSSSTPPVDALLAVYLSVVHAVSTKTPLSPAMQKALSVKSSFLYAKSMREAVCNQHALVGQILPWTIAWYIKLESNMEGSSSSVLEYKSVLRTLACCVTHPRGMPHLPASKSILASLDMIGTYRPSCWKRFVPILIQHVNDQNGRVDEVGESVNLSSSSSSSSLIKGQCSPTDRHYGVDSNAVRLVANRLATTVQEVGFLWILMHLGVTQKSGKQRAKLVSCTLETIRGMEDHKEDAVDQLAQVLALWSSSQSLSLDDNKEESIVVSTAMHHAARSALYSLGEVACHYTIGTDDPNDEEMKPYVFATNVCLGVASRLSERMETALQGVESLTEKQVDLFKSPEGSLFAEDGDADASTKPEDRKKGGGSKGRKQRGDFGTAAEDEEWERQMKKELAEKKKSQTSEVTLTPEQKKLVAEQDVERKRIRSILKGDFMRCLGAIRDLCLSDIEVGNACLPTVSEIVLAATVSECYALQSVTELKTFSFQVLVSLATCVYEILEENAPMLARALTISSNPKKEANGKDTNAAKSSDGKLEKITTVALPSPCASAQLTISEMDNLMAPLSGASFIFLLPVLKAALMGPRTTPGCEGALRVLERHTELLAGEEKDSSVIPFRKEMVVSILELLKHDRAQTFQDPTPYDALVECYVTDDTENGAGPALSSSELSPLLDERGALGKKGCRIASMRALGSIAERHRKLVKNNPLVENRIWLNCFDEDEDIRTEARTTWAIVNDVEFEEDSPLKSPSAMYAIPLLPLLSHSDKSIALAAASAYAHAMGLYPKTVDRNIQKLCSMYIESFPTGSADEKPKIPTPVAPKKKPLVLPPKKKTTTGLTSLKKKTTKKSPLAVAGIGKPKTTKKKIPPPRLKPKEERTFDRDVLENQFKTEDSKSDPEEDSPAKVSVRQGVLQAISSLTKSSVKVEMDLATLKLLTSFLVAYGIADSNGTVQGAARDALRDVVASKGDSDDAIVFLLPHLEAVLTSGVADESSMGSLPTAKVPRDVSASDRRKDGTVVALGSVALHLKGPENASKIDSTIDMLLATLSTPSEDVQLSVAECLVKLMKKGNTQDRIETILDNLMKDCLHGESLASRRGAAYGISAVVKGSGIATLKKYDVVKRLEEACSSGPSVSKEGSLFAIELLSSRLGLLFEPYVIVLLPSLLKSFSDSSDYVRSAAAHTAGLIMSKLSAHGVKLVMPAVLTAFNDTAWRTKQASIHMLGSMSHLAPKQLASALPKVVPKLTEAFSDTHPKVKASAQEALNEISTVIRNPEISSISPVLLKALTDPADHTTRALEALIETEFLHAIDAPSLALIVPILHRGLRDRGATTKRFGALIAGNICTMINDPKDFVPYLPILLPDLKGALLDPIPDVRSISAKSLGSLTRGLGEGALPDLRSWLVEKLRDQDASSAERSGAAQGLTEVLIACGSSTVETVMREEILPLRKHPQSSTREGVLWVLTFLPQSLGQGFTPLIDTSLPALIGGLSDESEPVREVAMRAGRVLIRTHGKAHVEKILPNLEQGVSDDDFRIRVASLMLMGDLLSMIGGTTVVKGDGETQDDIRRAERAQAQIALALGSETRKRVLSLLYISRSDSTHAVRQNAIQVWKTVVSVTGRALRDILPVLVGQVVNNLASGHPERTEVAGRCLGDLVSKLGDSVLPEIIPVLRNALYDGDEHTRRGVCVGLSEVLKCSTRDQILRFIEIIVKVVQDALCDDDEGVRAMAASSFQSLHSVVGSRALDEVVPALMVSLESTTSDATSRARALNGLTGILGIRSRELLPYIIPRLIERPITYNHAVALSAIAKVTGGTISSHFTTIIPSLIEDLAGGEEEKEREEAVRDCFHSISGNVEESGVNRLISEICSKCGSDKGPVRKECCWMLEVLVQERKELQDFYEQVPLILRELLYRFNDSDTVVLKAANSAFGSLSKHVPAEELVKHIEFIKNLIASIVSESRRRKGGVGDGEFFLPGFNMPKGLEPLLPIYQRGILYGNATIREVSASGLGELISLTAQKYLAGPLIIKMTGPLLRIVGDRNPSNVKIAILRTLGLILVKGGPALRAFVPQFQTTFVKALSDPSRSVRVEATKALTLLMPLSTRVDPLMKELVAGSLGKSAGSGESAGVAAVQAATLEALAAVLKEGGKKAKLPDSIPSALDASKDLLKNEDEVVREAAAKVLGEACNLSGATATAELIQEEILSGEAASASVRHGNACGIRHILSAPVGRELEESMLSELTTLVTSYMKDDKGIVKEAGCEAIGAVIGSSPDPTSLLRKLETDIIAIMLNKQERMDVHRAVARGLCLALELPDVEDRVAFFGKTLLDACLELALSGAQRIQFAYNDVLWLALDVDKGEDGLERYASIANFENTRSMKSLHAKVLSRIKEVTIFSN